MIQVVFSKRVHPGSYLIRAVTWSEWSHCELLLQDGRLLGAAAPHGVTYDTLDNRLSIASAVAVMSFPGDAGAAEAFATGQLGKPYDWKGVVGIGLHRDWEEDSSWWCSEFVGKALHEGGFMPYRAEAIQRLTPQHLWMLDQPFETLK